MKNAALILVFLASAVAQASVERMQIDCKDIISDSGQAGDPWGTPKNFSVSPLYYGHYQIIETSLVATGEKKRTIEGDLRSCQFGQATILARCFSDSGTLQAELTQEGDGYKLRLGRGLETERVIAATTCVSKTVEVDR